MAMEILLLSEVKNLGHEGDVVKVADGYARNFILPRKLGAPVTDATRRRLAKIRRERAVQEAVTLDQCRTLADEMAKQSVTITVKVGAEDKLFGSVTNADIAKALKGQGFDVDKHTVLLDAPLKALGVYDVKIRLHPEVTADLKVWVVEE